MVNKIILFTNARDEFHLKEWVAHHLRRKLNRIRDDNGNLRQPGELPFDLNIVDFHGNETENTLVRDRYSNKIHEFLNNL
jgi:hypothetical protein